MKLKRFTSFFTMALLSAVVLIATGCTPTSTGSVRDDETLTAQGKELEGAGADYSGPKYTVAIIKFKNKTPSKILGIGDAATDILRTIVMKAGLEPIVLSSEEMAEQDRLIELQQTGAIKTGKKDAAQGFDSIDFRISGSVSAYSEVEEGSEFIIGASKTTVARVTVDYALVDIATGKSLLADSGMGEYKKKVTKVLGVGSRSTFDTRLRDGALRDALSKVMTKMVTTLNSRPFTSRIAFVQGSDVVLRAGTKSRLEPGTVLSVFRPGQEIKDPDTGRVLGRMEKKIGEIIINSHQNESLSQASVKSGVGFKVGDLVKASN